MEQEVLHSLKMIKGRLLICRRYNEKHQIIDPAKRKVPMFQQKTKKIQGLINLSYFINKSRENGGKNEGIKH